jgi:HK97 family phage portal protein
LWTPFSLFKRNNAVQNTKESHVASSIIQYFLGRPITTPPDFVSLAKEGYQGNIYVYAAIRQIAMACAGIPWVLYNDKTSKKSKREEIESHPLLDLWNNPNPMQSRSKFIENTVGYLMLDGNMYIDKVSASPNKPPQELWTLRPDRMSIVPNKTSDKLVSHYIYTIGSKKQNIQSEDVLHVYMFNPLDDWYGMPPLRAAAMSLDQNNESKKWNVALLQNGAKPPGGFKTQHNLTDEQFNRLENKIDDMRISGGKSQRPIILEGGLEWQDMGLTPTDMNWLEGQKLSAREIAIAYGVPPELIGDNSNKTYSNYKEARQAFYTETILPLMDWLRDEVNNWLVPLFGDNLYLDYDKDEIEALQEDREAVWSRVKDANFLTIDEKRTAIGYEELGEQKGGNIILVTGSQVDLINLLPKPDDEAIDVEDDNDDETEVEDGEENGEEEGMQEAEETEEVIKSFTQKSFNMKSEEQKIAYFKAVNNQRDIWINSVSKMVQKQFKKEQLSLKKNLQQAKTYKDVEKIIVKNVDKNKSDWEKLIKAIYISVGEVFGKQTFNNIKNIHGPFGLKEGTFDIWKTVVIEWLATNSSNKVVNILNTTKEKLRNILSIGVDNGESIPDIAKRIDQLYLKQIIPNRSTVIARTEVISASNLGSRAGALQTGLPLEKEWISKIDKRTRDPHRASDGQQVAMDKPFKVMGQKLMFPGDTSMGASASNVIQCRCTEGYHVIEE